MAPPKLGKSSNGEDMHYSVGAIIQRNGKYLMIDRNNPPFGFACPAGHIDGNEKPEETVKREVKEETGLEVTCLKLLDEEELNWNWCERGVTVHYWYVFECGVNGILKRSEKETKSAGWYSAEEIKELKLEPSWNYWLKKIGVI